MRYRKITFAKIFSSMNKYLSIIAFSLLFATATQAQTTTSKPVARPKLVVGVVVDQMRWDFLYRYAEKYGQGGFNRLTREGYSCANTHINYSPSYTAAGHSCIYTGSVPAVHGIVGNTWYDLNEGKTVSNVGDSTKTTVGATTGTGKVSPNRLLVSTITDELKLATNLQSKVIGIALKDRGAILPAGHAANAAYFYDGTTGNWVTSSYYMQQLPAWVSKVNEQKLPAKLLAQNWNTILPLAQYTESHADDVDFEGLYSNEGKPIFEHRVSELTKTSFSILPATPYGNTITLEMAKAAIANENLGKGKYTDFLTVSLSSTDYIGHQFGPNSVEVEDCYLRLDKEFETFFAYLDNTIGKGNYLLFLTADHGAAHVPAYLQSDSIRIPAGVFDMDTTMKQLETKLAAKYGQGPWLLNYDNMQIYLSNKLIADKNVNRNELVKTCIDFIAPLRGINQVIDLQHLNEAPILDEMKANIRKGLYPYRSGDIYVLYQPGWFEDHYKGTTHGTIYSYDTHIPLVWMGWGITPGEDHSDVHMTDIAPTLAAILHIQEPNGNIGKVIPGLFKK